MICIFCMAFLDFTSEACCDIHSIEIPYLIGQISPFDFKRISDHVKVCTNMMLVLAVSTCMSV